MVKQTCAHCGEAEAIWARDDDVPFCDGCKEDDDSERRGIDVQWWEVQR